MKVEELIKNATIAVWRLKLHQVKTSFRMQWWIVLTGMYHSHNASLGVWPSNNLCTNLSVMCRCYIILQSWICSKFYLWLLVLQRCIMQSSYDFLMPKLLSWKAFSVEFTTKVLNGCTPLLGFQMIWTHAYLIFEKKSFLLNLILSHGTVSYFC